jgi:4-aminobutyrate--pyruvate transaminase
MPLLKNSTAQRDVEFHLHPATNLKSLRDSGPMVMSRGAGVRVFDAAGRSYLEGMAGLWCAALGFSDPRLIEAATRELKRLPFYHSFAGKVPDVVVDLAEKLVSLAPVPMSKAFFANSGSEANDSAIKIIWYVNNALGRPEKKKIISRIRGYHGVTIASGSLTGLPNNHRDFDLPIERFLHTDCPHHYRFAEPGESEEAFATRLAENLEQLIVREGPQTIAAFFAEPVMGAAGVVIPPATYFEKVQAVLRKYDVLFVADEVICGFGRTGNMWGCQTFRLKPDMITCAKALSAAYIPISALLVNETVAEILVRQSEKIGIFGHGFTYSGHPVAAAVAVEALRIYETEGIIDHVRQVAPLLQEGLRDLANHPLVGEVRGIGLIAGIEVVRDKTTKVPFPGAAGIGAYLAARCAEHGLITRAIGDTIAFSPPLIITESEIDELVLMVGKALDDTEAMVRTEQLR